MRKKIRSDGRGIALAADVNAAISANVGERASDPSTTSVSSRQHIVQRPRGRKAKP